MKRLKLFIFFSLIKIIALNSEQIYVAPILFVDENEERYEADENFQDDLTYELNEKKEFLGIEIIKTRRHIKNIRSSYDALKLCKEEKISYLICGLIKSTLGILTSTTAGLGEAEIDSALSSAERVQHAARHLIDSGILPKWNNSTKEIALSLYKTIL